MFTYLFNLKREIEKMGMVFCRGCGKDIHETAPTCPHCGALQGLNIKGIESIDIPDGVKGWSWGAFLLNWIWAIGNNTWIGLLALIPYLGLIHLGLFHLDFVIGLLALIPYVGFVMAIASNTWIGLLALIPYLGFVMAIILGIKGREWAWKNKKWESVEQFNRVQKKWSFWGVLLTVCAFVIGVLLV